ncbi:hypothetical protein KC358_g39 [Hortaea werneckii]|nr:hypothetical protein KC358_g39 [Hortaea werneckii]
MEADQAVERHGLSATRHQLLRHGAIRQHTVTPRSRAATLSIWSDPVPVQTMSCRLSAASIPALVTFIAAVVTIVAGFIRSTS